MEEIDLIWKNVEDYGIWYTQEDLVEWILSDESLIYECNPRSDFESHIRSKNPIVVVVSGINIDPVDALKELHPNDWEMLLDDWIGDKLDCGDYVEVSNSDCVSIFWRIEIELRIKREVAKKMAVAV